MKHIAIAVLLFLATMPAGAETPPLVETPDLAGAVAGGKLPAVEQRVPGEPAISDKPAGRPGGELHMLMSGAKDTRLMVVYGYARLVGYTPELTFAPDIAKSVDIEGDRSFTFHLRACHKWSDGEPFTAEDFRYWYEDVA
ncbi:MAG TPA: ABC transporter substrate-binding protein, partial [Stellaceae bacterium]|nr:ABC transporter substrate-binding protein [Stellaceae bacterium]